MLAIDNATTSGWCVALVHVDRTFTVLDSGTATNAQERKGALSSLQWHAYKVADTHGHVTWHDCPGDGAPTKLVPTMVTLEAHGYFGPKKTVAGLYRIRGAWEEQLALAELDDVNAVPLRTWRKTIGLKGNATAEAAKARAIEFASELLGRDVVDDNEAEAVGIAAHAAAHLTPKRRRKAC